MTNSTAVCEEQKREKSRQRAIVTASALGIVMNVIIAGLKVLFGLITSSMAIISEGVNNATDALTSVMTLVGTKLAGKHPDRRHPFGYGRLEYLTGLAIAVLILVTGGEVFISSVKLVITPEAPEYSVVSLVVVGVSAVIKFIYGVTTVRVGKKTSSAALVAVGTESRNDSFVSLVTIFAGILFLTVGFSIDAYVGILTALLIMKTGFDALKSTVSDLLGTAGEEELAGRLYRRIRQTEGILGAADMMLHNYGPDAYSGSVNVEMNQSLTVGEIYSLLHRLQLDIMHEEKVTMVFGVYAVDNDRESMRALRGDIAAFVREQPHVISYHAVYLDSSSDRLYCDLVVDYELHDWDGLRAAFTSYMKKCYPAYSLELVIETEYV